MKFQTLFIALVSLPTLASRIEILDESTDLNGLLPSYMIDHSGFDLPKNFRLKGLGFEGGRSFPFFPLAKSFQGSKKFIGIQVPAKYLGTEGKCKENSSNSTSITINTTNSSVFDASPEVTQAKQLIRSLKGDDGTRYNSYYYNCNLFGIDSRYEVDYNISQQVGFSLSLGFKKNTIHLGDKFVLGFDLNLGIPTTQMGKVTGLNLADSYNQIFDGIDMALTADKVETLIAKSIQFTPYISSFLVENELSQSSKKPTGFGSKYAKQLTGSKSIEVKIKQKVSFQKWSRELQNKLKSLNQNLNREVSWREKIQDAVNATLVSDNLENQQLIQNICDYLAQAYEVPIAIWPRCRIAATWVPNAWAFPGGDIFITAGLIGVLSDLDSVFLVLGHEIGHVLGRHISRQSLEQNLFMYTANGIGFASNIALMGFGLSGGAGTLGKVNIYNWFPKGMAASMGGSLVAGAAIDLAFLAPTAGLMARSRQMEWEADRFGHQAALAVGAKQNKVVSGWEEFKNFFEKNFQTKENFWKKLMSDHPSTKDRLNKFNKRGEEYSQQLQDVGANNRLPDDFYQRYATLHQQYEVPLQQWANKMSGKSKAAQDKRKRTLASFLSPASACLGYALGGNPL